MSVERIQKILSRAGVASRRKIEEMVREGRITVDGEVATVGVKVDLEHQAVKVDGKRIAPPAFDRSYILINKPAGVVSTVNDPEGRSTVLHLLPQRMRNGLVPVGRLDYHTEGLLILTDDGDFAHHVAHPRYGCRKTYEVKVKGRPVEAELERLRNGMFIDGKRTAAAWVTARESHTGTRKSEENSWWVMVLQEGRSRQIREMFLRVRHPVIKLRRVAVGSVVDPQLPVGAWRELRPVEIEQLRKRTARVKKPEKPKTATKPRSAKAGSQAAGPTKPGSPSRREPSKRSGPPKRSGSSKGSFPPKRSGPSGPSKRSGPRGRCGR